MLSTVLFRNKLPFWEDWRSSNYHHIHINISNMTFVTINEHINNKNVKVSKQLFLIIFLPFLYRVLFRGCQVLVNLIHFELPGPHLKSRLYATKIKKELKRSSYLLDTKDIEIMQTHVKFWPFTFWAWYFRWIKPSGFSFKSLHVSMKRFHFV